MALKDRLQLKSAPLFLMDGTAFIYRGFYANRHLQRSDGYPTNALVVVTRVILNILKVEKPEYFVFVMDGKGKNFRNEIYPEYKANRETMPEELVSQIEPIKKMVDALGVPKIVAEGIEADDCIASLSARFSRRLPVVIVSGDKDLKQCLNPDVVMWDPASKEDKILTEADFIEESGVRPVQWPDVQALIGDTSDNIPGVPGIGPKTARQIFALCPTLEDIRANIATLPPKIQEKLKDHLDKMFTWRELTTLRLDAFPTLELTDIAVKPINLEACGNLTDEFELFQIRKEITSIARSQNEAPSLAEHGNVAEAAKEKTQAFLSQVSDTAILPACGHKRVAVIWPELPPAPAYIAVEGEDDKEFIWTGSMRDLCGWLKDAHMVIVADFKDLLVKSPSWRDLFNSAIAPAYFDLGLASYLLSPEEGDYSWQRLSLRWREPLKGTDMGPASLALAMANALEKSLTANSMTELYLKMELPLAPVLAQMQLTGIAINPAEFHAFLSEVEKELNKLEKEVYAEAGETFNIRSSQQLGEILFTKLHLPTAKKTKGGQPSTSQLVLEKLAQKYPIVNHVLQYKRLDKMRSTYLDPLPRLMDSEHRLHTTFNQEATATGRLSSSNPNLQNIPVRGELGHRMRSCFVGGPGKLLVSADYSQIELRLLAHFSGDNTLLDAFAKGHDIHGRTASLIFDLAQEEITPDQRRMAKTINFGLLYGMGAQKLAQELKISTGHAKEFMDLYFSRLAGVREFFEKVLESVRKLGYVTTMAGRRRWLPGIFSTNGQIAAQAERQAINAVIQGTAADIIKMAMIEVSANSELQKMDARLVLQVHDELLLEAPETDAENCGRITAEIMENIRPGGKSLNVPLLVEWGAALNWGEAH